MQDLIHTVPARGAAPFDVENQLKITAIEREQKNAVYGKMVQEMPDAFTY